MKVKIIGWIIILSYPFGMYGLKGVDEWIGWLSMLLPFVTAILYGPISWLVDTLVGKDQIDQFTKLYIAFVISVFGVLCLNLKLDFAIGRFIMLIGGTLFYLCKRAKV